MSITKPKSVAAPLEKFILAAPDGGTSAAAAEPEGKSQWVRKGNKHQITLTLSLEILVRLTAFSKRNGVARAGVIALAISRFLDEEGEGR